MKKPKDLPPRAILQHEIAHKDAEIDYKATLCPRCGAVMEICQPECFRRCSDMACADRYAD